MYRILLVEDDAAIARVIQYYLAQSGEYEVARAVNAQEALQLAGSTVDLVLLDIMLPDTDGLELCAQLRQRMYCPIIFISCVDDEQTIIRALEIGGDDYLTKPFSCDVLNARIRANLRRVRMEKGQEQRDRFSYRDFEIDPGAHRLRVGDTSVPLAPIEFGVLMRLVDNPGRIVTLDELYEAVWGKQSFGDVRTVIVHVYNLRKKLGLNGQRYIRNVRGKGYVFDPEGRECDEKGCKA